MAQSTVCELTDYLMWFWGIMYFICIISLALSDTMTLTKFGFVSGAEFIIQLVLIVIKALANIR